jgi:hypothetical protein
MLFSSRRKHQPPQTRSRFRALRCGGRFNGFKQIYSADLQSTIQFKASSLNLPLSAEPALEPLVVMRKKRSS